MLRVFFGFALGYAGLAMAADEGNGKVDFRRDIQPLFQAHCIECHGPTQQMSNLRLDLRRSATKIQGGTRIGPGNAVGSKLYMRMVGTSLGQQMPPSGPLPAGKIDLVRKWIDQGAVWPDELSGDLPQSKPDPRTTRL